MIKVNIFEIKARLSEYLDRAAQGERIVICRHNRAIAELRPIDDVRVEPRTIGPIAGRPTFELAPTFFEPLSDDELEQWERGIAGPSAIAGQRVAERKVSHGRTRQTRRTK